VQSSLRRTAQRTGSPAPPALRALNAHPQVSLAPVKKMRLPACFKQCMARPAAGTDGQTTLGDAWWLDLEDIATPTPHTIAPSDLPAAPFALSQSAQEELAQQYDEQQRQYQQYQQQQGGGGGLPAGAAAPPLAAQQVPAASGAFPYLPAALTSSLPAVPAGLSSAFSSFKERLGLPATASQSSLSGASAGAGPAGAGAGPAMLPHAGGGRDSAAAARAAAGAAAAAAARLPAWAAGQGLGQGPAVVDAAHDEGLLDLGQRALMGALGEGAGVEGGGWDAGQLVQAARGFLVSCQPEVREICCGAGALLS
jgi:hypothetical protein